MISTKTRLKLAKMLQAFAEVTTDKGTLVFEGPLDAGLEVFVYDEETGDLVSASDGTYVLEDNTKIEVAEGKVVSVESPEPDNTPEPEPEPVNNDDQEPEPQGEDKDAKIKELEDQLVEKDNKIEELQKKIEELEGIVKEENDKFSKVENENNELKEQLKMSADKPAYRSLKDEVKESKAGSILSSLKK